MNLRIRKIYFLVVVVLCSVTKGYNQIVTSIGNGLWTDPTIWDSGQVPTPLNATSTIVNHELEIPGAASVSVQNVTVYGRLTVSSAAIVDVIADGLPDKWDLQVFGNLVMNDGATLNGTSLLNTSFESGARYIHFQGPLGFIPYATWHSNSTFEIAGFRTQGYINIAHSNSWRQIFGNVVYNCTQQTTAFVDLNGYLRDIAGNLHILSTNNQAL